MRARWLAPALALTLLAPARAQDEAPAPGYTFRVDGEATTPEIRSLRGTPAAPQAGDAARVAGYWIVLDEPGEYTFETGKQGATGEEGSNQLVRLLDGGRREVWAALIDFTIEKRERLTRDGLGPLTAEQRGQLRGVAIKTWSDSTAEALRDLDPTRCFLDIRRAPKGSKTTPKLPADLRYLQLASVDEPGPALAGQVALRLLALRYATLGADDLPAAAELRWLELSGATLSSLKPLGALSQLRHLDLAYVRAPGRKHVTGFAALAALTELRVLRLDRTGVDDLAFVRPMRALRILDLDATKVADLSPLSDHPALEELAANSAPLTALPGGKLPALKRLVALGHELSRDERDRFAAANPDAALLLGWNATLATAAARAIRVRVRTGGTCHRNIEEEKTLFEQKGKERVKALMDAIEIVERGSGFHCMCCGSPSIELYDEDDNLLVMLGFHHARSLRWSGGDWPGDGQLTARSAGAICRWMADHGYTKPLEDHMKEQIERKAADRLRQQISALLPAPVLAALQKASGRKEAAAAFDKVADADARARLAIAAYGVNYGAWNQTSSVDGLFEAVLGKVPAASLARALAEITADEARDRSAAARGAARWLFGEGKLASTPAAQRDPLVTRLAPVGLTHPQATARSRTLVALHKHGGDAARDQLRRVLAGELPPTKVPEGAGIAQGGMVEFRSSKLKRGASDRANAALLLAEMGDKASLPAIEALAKAAEGKDLEALQAALAKLQGAQQE